MLTKLRFCNAKLQIGVGDKVIDREGLAFPVLSDSTEDSLDVLEVVEVNQEKLEVLTRPFTNLNEDAWAEISGSYEIKTDPGNNITKDPAIETKGHEEFEVLMAVIDGEVNVIQGDPVRIVGYRAQAGIVDVVPHPEGEYVIIEIIAEMSVPRKGLWVQIEPDYDDDNDNDFAEKVKVKIYNA